MPNFRQLNFRLCFKKSKNHFSVLGLQIYWALPVTLWISPTVIMLLTILYSFFQWPNMDFLTTMNYDFVYNIWMVTSSPWFSSPFRDFWHWLLIKSTSVYQSNKEIKEVRVHMWLRAILLEIFFFNLIWGRFKALSNFP